jgi:beta-galactosidase
MRNITLLNQGWRFIKTAATAQEAASTVGTSIALPHTWNAKDGQDGGNDYYRGTCWYVKTLSRPKLEEGGRAYLQFDGAAMTADVYLNGSRLTHHEGGYSTFRADITDCLQDDNTLAVAVDNSDNDRVYPQKADFTFYGGLYRSVKLVTVPAAHFSLDYAGSSGIRVTPIIEGSSARVNITVWANGAEGMPVTIAIDGVAEACSTVKDGKAEASLSIANVHLWNGVADPYLYTATATLPDDKISTSFGCRTFSMDPNKGFILNGRPYPLRGVSRHQDRAGVGNALTPEMHAEDMEIIRKIGATTVRLAHYQHAQEFYDLCDKNGIVAWAEIPYITMHMKNGRANTLSQMKELVVQNYNHPSIVCWGLSNEITAASTVNDDLLENHRELNDLCHRLDPTRPTTMANVFMLETDSPILKIPDLNSYNLYFGWYLGELEQNERFFDEYHAKYPNRCIGLSEYGADANPQFQTSSPERGDYSEQYQALYHEHMLAMIEARPWLWATHVWNLFDFAADGRDEGGKHGVNQKGLVTMDRKIKKDAFYLYKAYWSKEPFVHICGSRYIDRAEEVTEIKIYSNQSAVTLFVDGKKFGVMSSEHIFKFNVPITGEHTIEAKAGAYSSVAFVRKVSEPNKDYLFTKESDIVNWFSKEDFDPTCYSISDTLGEISKSAEANAIVQRLTAKAAASRGDVAESVKDNPGLQRMMQRITLQSMLKQTGDAVSTEQMKELNAALQRIKKPE